MKILISPAKKLNTDPEHSFLNSTECSFLNQSEIIMNTLSNYSVSELEDLMKVSVNIARLNKKRNKNWNLPFKSGKQAIHVFNGEVYSSMNIRDFNMKDFKFANNNLRILSGLYGILKPSDIILPYRLEMGTKIKIGKHNNLYEFWKEVLISYLLNEIKDDELLVNLASDEYFKVLDENKIKIPIITPVFKDFKNGKLKVVSFYAKRARGKMCNYIIKNKIDKIDDLKLFNVSNYVFNAEESSEKKLVFVR